MITRTGGKSSEHRKVQVAGKKRDLGGKRGLDRQFATYRRTSPVGTVAKKDTVKKSKRIICRKGRKNKSIGGEQSVKLIIKGTNFCLSTGDKAVVSDHL